MLFNRVEFAEECAWRLALTGRHAERKKTMKRRAKSHDL